MIKPRINLLQFLVWPLVLIIALGFFWYKGASSLDPDFGWHLRVGQLILNSGIPKTDPFSYTMPSFPFVDHEWLTNVIWAKIYPSIGQPGLSIIYGFLATVALLISLSIVKFKNNLLKLGLFVLSAATVLPFFGVRPQVLSWFFLALLLKIVVDELWWKKLAFFLPLFFVLWANLHGSFAIGVFVLFLFVFLKAVRVKKLTLSEVLICFGCLLATLINPYGIRLWGEVWRSISDTQLRFRIVEWLPSFFYFHFCFLALISLSGLLIYHYHRRFSLEKKGIFLFFLWQAILSQRHIPLWVMVGLPVITEGVKHLAQEAKRIKEGCARFKKLVKFFTLGCLVFFFLGIFLFFPGFLTNKEESYPLAAVNYLKNNLPAGEIFSTYNWGGYLIWKLPEKKVFIDGRMPSWRWRKNLSAESGSAMEDYEKILKGENPFSEVEMKYNITTVLFPSRKPPNPFEQFESKLLGLLGKKASNDFLGELVENGWQKIYEDPKSVIYCKRK